MTMTMEMMALMMMMVAVAVAMAMAMATETAEKRAAVLRVGVNFFPREQENASNHFGDDDEEMNGWLSLHAANV